MTTTTSLEELTLGAATPIAGHFEFRPELRGDFSNQTVYPGMKKNQFTLTGAFLAYF